MSNLRNSFTACLLAVGGLALLHTESWAAKTRGPQVRIPVGEFQMGTKQGTPWERPVHKGWVNEFYIDRYEISNKDYETFQPGHRRSHMSSCDECPVTLVTWHEAEAYCRHKGSRLPTEAEWEKTARGPEGWNYSFGQLPDPEHGHFGKEFLTGAIKVFSFQSRGYGAYQMSGNVWEWNTDCYQNSYLGTPDDGSAFKAPKCRLRVFRGSSWMNSAKSVRSSNRSKNGESDRLNTVGFRLALDQ